MYQSIYPTSHSFDKKKEQGSIGEKIMDEYFSRWYYIKNISVSEQLRVHYDRIFYDFDSNISYKIEYKTDLVAVRTKNFFIETESSSNSLGWIYKSKADWLAVLVGRTIYLVNFYNLKYLFLQNIDRYIKKNVKPTITKNNSYNSVGYLMPIKDLEKISSLHFLSDVIQ